jgi:hypothetical protein
MQPRRFLRAIVFSVLLCGASRMAVAARPPRVEPESPEPPAFREFSERVQQYVKLQRAMPRLRTTKKRKEIVERRRALAEKICEARANAKQGDFFTPAVSEEFRRVIQNALQGPNARNVRKTLREGEPLQGWHLSVNGDYPEHLPMTTVPVTLLLRLPQLPPEVAYRIIGHDFVLEDKEARLILDFIVGAVP